MENSHLGVCISLVPNAQALVFSSFKSRELKANEVKKSLNFVGYILRFSLPSSQPSQLNRDLNSLGLLIIPIL